MNFETRSEESCNAGKRRCHTAADDQRQEDARADRNVGEVIDMPEECAGVDAGGGGTVAMFLAKLNMEVIDLGVPILSMHSPFEVASKVDIFENYRAIRAFFEQK